MFLRPASAAAAFALGVSALCLGACAPITSHQGFQAIDATPKDVKVGVDTKSTVLEKLGTPSSSSIFGNETWYYITQITDQVAFYKPQVKSRDIYAISFNKADEQVAAVKHYTLKDGKVFAYNSRETPTRGRELSILEQLLGNVGRGSLAPTDDTAPGQRPGQ